MKKLLFLLVLSMSLVLTLATSTTYAYIGDYVPPTEQTLSNASVQTFDSTTTNLSANLSESYIYINESWALDSEYEQDRIKLISKLSDGDSYTYYVSEPHYTVGHVSYTYTTVESVDNVAITINAAAGDGDPLSISPITLQFNFDGTFEYIQDTTTFDLDWFDDTTFYLVPKNLVENQVEKYDDVQEITNEFVIDVQDFTGPTYSNSFTTDLEDGWYYIEYFIDYANADTVNIENLASTMTGSVSDRNLEFYKENDYDNFYTGFSFEFLIEDGEFRWSSNNGYDIDSIHMFNGVPGQGVTEQPQPSTGGIISDNNDTLTIFGIEWYWLAAIGGGAYLLLGTKKGRKAIGLK